VSRVGKAVYPCDAVGLGPRHWIVRGSGCKARGAARGGYHGQAVQRPQTPQRSDPPARPITLVALEQRALPTLRDRADFPSSIVVASLLGIHPTASAPPRLRGNLPRSRPREILRQAPTPYIAAMRTASSTSTATSRDTPGSFIVDTHQLRSELHGALVVRDEYELHAARHITHDIAGNARPCSHRAARLPRSSRQNGAGFRSKIANTSATAVTGLFAPGKLAYGAVALAPAGAPSRRPRPFPSPSSVSSRYACPPPNKRGNFSLSPALTRSNVSWKRVRVSRSLLRIADSKVSNASVKSLH